MSMTQEGPLTDAVPSALRRLGTGGMALVRGTEDEPAQVVAVAATCDAATINFMATHARGIVCLALAPERCDRLGLAPMANGAEATRHRPFTVSIEARNGVTTGISTEDRARTVKAAIAPDATAQDVTVPGHVFPLRCHVDGVLGRPGIAEAAADLARLAGGGPYAVTCAVLDDRGEVADDAYLFEYAELHDLPVVPVEALVAYRAWCDPALRPAVPLRLPAHLGAVDARRHVERTTGRCHLTFVRGSLHDGVPTVVVRQTSLLNRLRDAEIEELLGGPAATVVIALESEPDDDACPDSSARLARELLVRIGAAHGVSGDEATELLLATRE
jgi:3,4-dihydroxy 2-butanone 4-phosphate synthase/GTP cyclohydrolase II